MLWKVKFYRSHFGNCPVEDFIKKQNDETYARILHSIAVLGENGPFLKPPYSKKIQSKLYELRVVGKTSIRIFYTVFKDEYYLLHAFKKESQKTPPKEIKTALDRAGDLHNI